MYKIIFEYNDGHKEMLGVGIYKKNEEPFLVLGVPARKYKTFEQAIQAVIDIKNGNFANGNFIDYEIINC